jgi:hypothetical protein
MCLTSELVKMTMPQKHAEELIALYEQAMALDTLEPRKGFDDIGRAFCALLLKKRTHEEVKAILDIAMAKYPNFISDFQRISFESEHLHEKWHADKLLNGEYETLDDLKEAYGYSWIEGKARAELAQIPDIEGAKVHYYCGAMVPFSVMALLDLRDDLDITLIDDDKDRLIYSRKVLDSEERYCDIRTEYVDLSQPQIKEADIAFLIGARFQCSEIFDALFKSGCKHIVINGCEGLSILMYPPLINMKDLQGYELVKGYTPLHVNDVLRPNFKALSDLSYLSMAYLKQK